MSNSEQILKIAAIQASPIFLNREATTEKACKLIAEAGRNGANVIGFPEGFIPGHPLWYHFHPASSPYSIRLATRLFQNSVEIPSSTTDELCNAARKARVNVVIGLCEKIPETFGTMYNTQLFISEEGHILGKHQKLVPTIGERLVHTGGYGDTLHAFDTRFGKISGLICGENNNPLAIFALIAEGTKIHVASWPDTRFKGASFPVSDRAASAGRAVAMMSKAFVINALGTLNDDMIDILAASDEDRAFLTDPQNSGGSSIINPQSDIIAGPLGPEEKILYADADLRACISAKIVHDLSGHYNRADIFNVRINRAVPKLYESVHVRYGEEELSSRREDHMHAVVEASVENMESNDSTVKNNKDY